MTDRRAKLEAMLEQSPDDPFLHYAIALEDGKPAPTPEAVLRMERVTNDFPDYVPAWFQLGQWQATLGETEAARATITQGIEVARRVGDDHALGEMTGFLAEISA